MLFYNSQKQRIKFQTSDCNSWRNLTYSRKFLRFMEVGASLPYTQTPAIWYSSVLVELSHYLTSRHIGEVEENLCQFSTKVLEWGGWAASRPGRFTAWERNSVKKKLDGPGKSRPTGIRTPHRLYIYYTNTALRSCAYLLIYLLTYYFLTYSMEQSPF
jgi:hypothetical protein